MTATVRAPAKINLWLAVGDLQPSGFHDLDTLFCALELEDDLTIRAAPAGSGTRLRVDFATPLETLPDLGPDDRNLAVRAVRAFADRAGIRPDLEIHLLKRIPAGGGLGGGSSDAAAVLRAMDRAHLGALSDHDLLAVAAGLGSDVPFFLSGAPMARGRGRGTELYPVPALPPRPVVLLLPGVPVATADAYRWLDQDRAAGDVPPPIDTPAPSSTLDWDHMRDLARNDFDATVFRRYPQLRQLRDTLVKHGASPAMLAGSGSSLFGVFNHDGAAMAAMRDVPRSATAVLTRTRAR